MKVLKLGTSKHLTIPMPWYNRLRWRLIGVQILVAVVGVIIMIIATQIIIIQTAPDVIRPQLAILVQDAAELPAVKNTLLNAFRTAVLGSVGIAAIGAVLAGTVTSYLLWRTLVVPLRRLALASQRVADGRYSERLPVPQNVGEALAQVATNFNHMAAALEETEQKRVTLIGNVTHELRTPLTSLRGFVEGLEDGLFPANEETFTIMEEEIGRLSRLVEDIQTLSRVESGAIQLHFHTVDLTPLVRQAIAKAQPQALAKQINLVFQPPAAPIHSHIDSDRTAQILTNLIGNAIRYTPGGGQVSLTLTTDSAVQTAIITVTDNGIGIPADALPYVFERFYRVDDSRSRQSGGSGVGLTISRHLAWSMGGELTAASAGSGQGSTFALMLPLVSLDTT